MLGDGTCHSSIGLVTLKLGLRPSFILNEKLCLFLDLDVGRWDLSLQHWTCHLEAGPSAQLESEREKILFLDLDAGALDLSHQRWTCDFEAGSATQLHS